MPPTSTLREHLATLVTSLVGSDYIRAVKLPGSAPESVNITLDNLVALLQSSYLLKPVVPESNSNNVFRCDAPGGASTFVGTIATLPGGATLTYNVSSGNEGVMVPQSTGQLAKLVLHNTTRGTYALISNCNVGTNTLTLTANVPGGWVVGDTITPNSQTVTGGPITFMDLEFTTGVLNRSALWFTLNIISATLADNARIHPFETFGGGKQKTAQVIVINVNNVIFNVVTLNSNRFALGWTGTPANVILTEDAYTG